MFKKLIFIEEANRQFVYDIIDSQFRKRSYVSVSLGLDATANRTLAMLQAYNSTKLPLAKNIALFYIERFNENGYFGGKNGFTGHYVNLMKQVAEVVDRCYPEINYSAKYLPCVINYIEKRYYV